MLNNQIVAASTTTREDQDQDHDEIIRDIYALTPPDHRPANRPRRREAWETSSHRSSSLSMASSEIGGPSSTTSTENFTSISREFNALVIAGSSMANNNGSDYTDTGMSNSGNDSNLARIGEENEMHETNPLAIVPDNYNHLDPSPSSPRHASSSGGVAGGDGGNSGALAIIGSQGEVSVQRVKREEVQSKISAWQTAKVAKINNRFKREEAVINGWESEQVQKATSWMKKVERKLEDKRARALEKMQNDIAKARRKAEEKRASAEAKRGTKAARVFEIANLMKAVGRAPAKRSFF